MTLLGRQIVGGIILFGTLGTVAAIIWSGYPQGAIGDAVRANDLATVQKLLRSDPALANAKVMPQGSTTGRLRTEWRGRFVMHDAVQQFDDRTPILEALASAGADLSVRQDGRTLLHLAASSGNVPHATWLLDRGADVNARNDCASCPERGQTPLHEAQRFRDQELNDLLLSRGADVTAADASGQTPLHASAAVGSVTGAWRLCLHGANPQARDRAGRTPQDVAREADKVGRGPNRTEIYGVGELVEWLKPDGACRTLSDAAANAGKPASEEQALVVFRQYACARGATNACAGQ